MFEVYHYKLEYVLMNWSDEFLAASKRRNRLEIWCQSLWHSSTYDQEHDLKRTSLNQNYFIFQQVKLFFLWTMTDLWKSVIESVSLSKSLSLNHSVCHSDLSIVWLNLIWSLIWSAVWTAAETAVRTVIWTITWSDVNVLFFVNVNVQDEEYSNMLQTASVADHDKVVELLLSKSVKINVQDEDYDNALYAASVKDHDKVVKLLFSKSVKINTWVFFLSDEWLTLIEQKMLLIYMSYECESVILRQMRCRQHWRSNCRSIRQIYQH